VVSEPVYPGAKPAVTFRAGLDRIHAGRSGVDVRECVTTSSKIGAHVLSPRRQSGEHSGLLKNSPSLSGSVVSTSVHRPLQTRRSWRQIGMSSG